MRARNRVDLVCEQCKKTFWAHAHRKDIARFCSRECYHKWRTGYTVGAIDLPVADIVSAYESGVSGMSLADKYNVSYVTIYDRLKQAGIKRRKPTGENLKTPEALQASSERASKRIGKLHPGYMDLPVGEIAARYSSGDSSEQIARDYGVCQMTILRRVREAGVRIRPAGYVERRECPDGHIVDSGYEYDVDKWLFEHSIEHDVHPYAPWWNGGKSPSRADFKVGNTYIEIWGISNNKRYNARRRKKVAQYKECGAKLIEIFPHHIMDGDLSPLEILL